MVLTIASPLSLVLPPTGEAKRTLKIWGCVSRENVRMMDHHRAAETTDRPVTMVPLHAGHRPVEMADTTLEDQSQTAELVVDEESMVTGEAITIVETPRGSATKTTAAHDLLIQMTTILEVEKTNEGEDVDTITMDLRGVTLAETAVLNAMTLAILEGSVVERIVILHAKELEDIWTTGKQGQTVASRGDNQTGAINFRH